MPFSFRNVLAYGAGLAAIAALGCTREGPTPAPSAAVSCPELPLERTRRLYDFKPLSPANPAVARVDGCAIVIPLSEFQGHLGTEVLPEQRVSLTRDDKKEQLEKLIDEHLLLEDAYRAKADEVEGIVNTLNGTRKMLLGEFLTAREVDARAKTGPDQIRLRKQLLDRAFQKAQIVVSNEGHAALGTAAGRFSGARVDPGDAVAGLPEELRERSLATFQDTSITVGHALRGYLQTPEGSRPDIRTREGLTELLKQILEQDVLAMEATAQGIDRTRPYLEKVEQNRSALVRMWSQDRSAARARQQMESPEIHDRLRHWYREWRDTRYTYKDEQGKPKVLPFEGNEESIRNDYYDALRDRVRAEDGKALRKGRSITIDEAALDQA
jgi:hypothetical protein